jgi:hypothetical protein
VVDATHRIIEWRPTRRVYDIFAEVAITVGAASKAVDLLEAAGWCACSANPVDRRSSLLALPCRALPMVDGNRPFTVPDVTRRSDPNRLRYR